MAGESKNGEIPEGRVLDGTAKIKKISGYFSMKIAWIGPLCLVQGLRVD